MIVYKVVRHSEGNLYLSSNIRDDYKLHYRTGELTKAKNNSLIFCYIELDHALSNTAVVFGEATILKCETPFTPEPINSILRVWCRLDNMNETLESFWRNKEYLNYPNLTNDSIPAPKNTFGVPFLTPLRILNHLYR